MEQEGIHSKLMGGHTRRHGLGSGNLCCSPTTSSAGTVNRICGLLPHRLPLIASHMTSLACLTPKAAFPVLFACSLRGIGPIVGGTSGWPLCRRTRAHSEANSADGPKDGIVADDERMRQTEGAKNLTQ
jgi:hypothetical protein